MKQLTERNMAQRAEHARSVYFASIPPGTSFDDLLVPSYWAHCVGRLKVNTLIEAVADDGSFDALLRVTERDVGFARVRVLYVVKDERQAVTAGDTDDGTRTDLPRIQHIPNGQSKGWRVLGLDGGVVKEGIPHKSEAEALLASYKQRAGI